MLLTARGASLRVKGKLYRACVQRVLVYGSETWPMKKDDMQRLVRKENTMIRWMSGVTLKDRRPSEELRLKLGIEGADGVVRRGRLRCFGYVERKEADDWVSHHHHHFVFRLLLIIVHTKARVRRYQQLTNVGFNCGTTDCGLNESRMPFRLYRPI